MAALHIMAVTRGGGGLFTCWKLGRKEKESNQGFQYLLKGHVPSDLTSFCT
jgi:hypothetical protein